MKKRSHCEMTPLFYKNPDEMGVFLTFSCDDYGSFLMSARV